MTVVVGGDLMSSIRRLRPSSENTRSAIFDMVRSSGTVSRLELAEMSGLTPTSITRVVKSLIEDGLVIETGFGDSTGGKRRSLLELDPHARYAVGVSLDDARLTYVIVDLGGTVIGHLVSAGIGQTAPGEVILRIADELEELLRQLEIPTVDIVGVGVAGAGLDLGAGAERVSLVADDWDSFAVQEALGSRMNLPVVRDNDAACAALGQFWAGRMSAAQDFATLYMSNGFGLGLVIDGGISRGSSSNVGEIGHMILEVEGPECWCGSRGCLEMIAGPRSIVAGGMLDPGLIEELDLSGDDSRLRHDFDSIARAAAAGDERCTMLIERSARYVAAAMLSVVNLLDLSRIYLAGPGFVDAGAFYVTAISGTIASLARTRAIHEVEVTLSDPGLDAAAVGAASLALQHVLTPHTRAEHGATAAIHRSIT